MILMVSFVFQLQQKRSKTGGRLQRRTRVLPLQQELFLRITLMVVIQSSFISCQANKCVKSSHCYFNLAFQTRRPKHSDSSRAVLNKIRWQQQQQQQKVAQQQQRQPFIKRRLFQSLSNQDNNHQPHKQQPQQQDFAAKMTTSQQNQSKSFISSSTSSTNKPSKLNIKYNFARGHPNPSLLPVNEMQQILYEMSLTSKASISSNR